MELRGTQPKCGEGSGSAPKIPFEFCDTRRVNTYELNYKCTRHLSTRDSPRSARLITYNRLDLFHTIKLDFYCDRHGRQARIPQTLERMTEDWKRGGEERDAARAGSRSPAERRRSRSPGRGGRWDSPGRRVRSRSPPGRQRQDQGWRQPSPGRGPPPGGRGGGGFRGGGRRGRPGGRDEDIGSMKWGRPGEMDEDEEKIPEKEPEPDFGLSGALAAETNTVKCVGISEPQNAGCCNFAIARSLPYENDLLPCH